MSLAIGKVRGVLPLVDGERLTAAEFRRRYEAMPAHVRAELIEGVVSMPSPVKFRRHAKLHFDVAWFLGHYTVFTPGVLAGDNATVRLDDDNEPQPDLSMFIEASSGGQTIITEDDYIEGAPELIVEVANTSVRLDLDQKYRVYQKCRAREYLVCRGRNKAFEWYVFEQNQFVQILPDSDGIFRSVVFPGLWLYSDAMLRRDLAAVLTVLTRGLASPEHAAFVAKLAAAKKPA